MKEEKKNKLFRKIKLTLINTKTSITWKNKNKTLVGNRLIYI